MSYFVIRWKVSISSVAKRLTAVNALRCQRRLGGGKWRGEEEVLTYHQAL